MLRTSQRRRQRLGDAGEPCADGAAHIIHTARCRQSERHQARDGLQTGLAGADHADRRVPRAVALSNAGARVCVVAHRMPDQPVVVPAGTTGRILLVTDGEITTTSATGKLYLVRGDAALLSAGEDGSLTGQGTAFVGGPGIF